MYRPRRPERRTDPLTYTSSANAPADAICAHATGTSADAGTSELLPADEELARLWVDGH